MTTNKTTISPYTISIQNGIARQSSIRLPHPINLTLASNENWAIFGENGAGKTLLIEMINGNYPLTDNAISYNFQASSSLVSDNIRYITFRDINTDSFGQTYYYQQRWNHGDLMEDIPSIKELLSNSKNIDKQRISDLIYLFKLEDSLDKPLLYLSSGERRRFELIKALSGTPSLLILDNPFIGLDTEGRALMNEMFARLISLRFTQLILVVSRREDVPPYVSHVLHMHNGRIMGKETVHEFQTRYKSSSKGRISVPLPTATGKQTVIGPEIIRFQDIHISYGNHTIISNLNWTIRDGEKWALAGENGSGKSTLLGLICADNPMAYACNIFFRGRKRGSGESIWDIKKCIGYVSPEIFNTYRKNLTVMEIVCSGLYDSIGLYHKPKASDFEQCSFWVELFGLKHLEHRSFLTLSSGEQRMTLLARAFVKSPDILILDEPFHGLDDKNRNLATKIIEDYCTKDHKTLIMVSHYENEFPQCIDHIMHLKKQDKNIIPQTR